MSTDRSALKRIQVPLNDLGHKVIGELAVEMECSNAKVCQQMLMESIPMMEQLTETLRNLRMGALEGKPVSVRHLAQELERLSEEAKQGFLELEQKIK